MNDEHQVPPLAVAHDDAPPQAASSENPGAENPGVEQADVFHDLAERFVVLEQRVGYVFTGIFGVILISFSSPAFLWAGQSPWIGLTVPLAWLALLGPTAYLAHVWPKMEFRHTQWRVNDAGMEIRRGVFWRHRVSIPTARVQHVDVSQGPVQRLFRLGKLTIHTAGTKNASVELDGLEYDQALLVRDQLIEQKESLDVT